MHIEIGFFFLPYGVVRRKLRYFTLTDDERFCHVLSASFLHVLTPFRRVLNYFFQRFDIYGHTDTEIET